MEAVGVGLDEVRLRPANALFPKGLKTAMTVIAESRTSAPAASRMKFRAVCARRDIGESKKEMLEDIKWKRR